MRSLLLLFFLLFSCLLHASPIAVVYAERSVPASEQRYAKSLASHVRRWYTQAGIAVDFIPDSALASAQGHKLIVLVDVYSPPAEVIRAVDARLKEGTRFVVCYSGSEALASRFGLKLGAYRRDNSGAWSRMVLASNRPKGAPASILQTSSTIVTMSPARKDTLPMAWWHNRAGKQTEVAWWKTSSGSYWMTHVLTGDGDEQAKQRLLLAFAASCVPGTWGTASRHLLRTKALSPLNDGSLEARARRLPRSSPRRRAVETALVSLRRMAKNAEKLASQDSPEAYQAASDLADAVARTFGKTCPPRTGEVCGVWDHSGQGLFPGDWERTAKVLATYGITDLYLNVAGAGFALYPSSVLPQRGAEDQLAKALSACRRHGIRLHAWVLAFSLERAASQDVVSRFRKRGWTLQDAKGAETTWLDPSNPEVRAHLLAIVRELATRYAVDGIHLDFVRFPDLPQSVGPRIRARFEREVGKVSNWSACVTSPRGANRQAFIRWRTSSVTQAVQDVRTYLKEKAPGKVLSVAVFGKYPACVDNVGQDWLSWLRMGLVDAALPMNYTEDEAALQDWLGTQTADPRLASKIICGIGVTASESRLDPIGVIRQVEIARRSKCRGFALFDLDEYLRKAILPVLSEGVTAHD